MMILVIAVAVTILMFIILSYDGKAKGLRLKARSLLAIVIGAVVLGSGSIAVLSANRVGVLYDPFKGGTQDEVLQEGVNFKYPWTEVYEMSTSIKLLTLKDITVQTNGGQWLKVEMEVQLSISPETAMLYYRKYRNISLDDEYLKNILASTIQREVENVVVKYDIIEVISDKKGEINIKVDKAVSEELAKDGLLVTRAVITDADAGEAIEKQIEKVYVAKLAAEEAVHLKEKAINEGEARIAEAEAAAKANKLLEESLTEIILQERFIQKWDGILPVFWGSTSQIFDVSKFVK